MANSRQGQYQLEFLIDGYTAPTRSHYLRLNCAAVGSPAAGTPAASVILQQKSGSTTDLQSAANQVWSFFRNLYSNANSVSGFNLWYWATDNARDFISAGVPTNPTGFGGTIIVAGQSTLSFRSAGGGIAKLVFIESTAAGDTRTSLIANGAGTPQQRIAAYAISGDSVMTALDNSFLVAPLRDARGQNEAVWRKIYRAT